MGTEFVITAYASDAQRAETAFAAAFARIAALDQALSNYRSDSELMKLSHSSPHPSMVPVSDELWTVLRAADQVSRQSSGAFDVTVGPVAKLWRRARRDRRWPDPQRMEQARSAVGYQHVQYDVATRAVRLTLPDMLLDLGGIAKGYALDQALSEMRRHQVTRVLVNGGGDVLAGDAPPGQVGWRVGVAGLQADAEAEQWLVLQNLAVATSGDLWQFVEIDGRRYSHLIDPRTGVGLTERSSVTVVAPTGMQADAWASALSVMGSEAGFRALRSLEGVEARVTRLVDQAVRVDETGGFGVKFRTETQSH
jgi:FAD:protein FMN transferase